MNMRKFIYATFVAVVVMFMASMTVSANSPGNVDDLSAAEQYNYTMYTGQIGPYPITLYIDLSASVNEYCGYYYYNSRPNSKFTLIIKKLETINLHGSMKVVLYEYTSKGNHTGTFNGQLEGRGDGFSGMFTNSKGTKFRFHLTESY